MPGTNAPDELIQTQSRHRDATLNVRARHALARTGPLNVNTKSLALGPVLLTIPNPCSGMCLVPQVRGMSPHKSAGPLGKWLQCSPPKHQPLPSLNRRRKKFRPLLHFFIPSVIIVYHPVWCSRSSVRCEPPRLQSLGRTRFTRRIWTTLPALCFHHFLFCCHSYPPGFHLSPMSHYRSWELNGPSFPIQHWGS